MARRIALIEVDADQCCPSVLEAPIDAARASELARGFAALADPARLRVISIDGVGPPAPSRSACKSRKPAQ